MILKNTYVFKILKQILLKLGMPVGCFFSHHSVTVAGIRSPAMRKQTHDDLISNFGETPSDPRCELKEHRFVASSSALSINSLRKNIFILLAL